MDEKRFRLLYQAGKSARMIAEEMGVHRTTVYGWLEICGLKPNKWHRDPVRRKQILNWIGEGKSNLEIAAIMGIACQTVKNHIKLLMDEFGCSSRLQLALAVARKKWEAEREMPASQRSPSTVGIGIDV